MNYHQLKISLRFQEKMLFFQGKKDGVARYWHENNNLQSEEQWFDGKENGLFRIWNKEGQLISANRYKMGALIEVLKK